MGHPKKQVGRNAVGWALAAPLALSLGGCSGFFKRFDATDPAVLTSTTKKFATEVAPQTNLVRGSGSSIYLRLKRLFPTSTDVTLPPADFDALDAKGLNKVLAQAERPSNSLAQTALRFKLNTLCATAAATPSAAGALFSASGVLLAGEALPVDTADKLAFVAARNAWLDLYSADDAEVKKLAELYRKAKASGATDAVARQSLCLAALTTGQFWIGNPGPRDALKRVALELGRRAPTLQELRDYQDGKLRLSDFVAKLQTDPAEQPRYLAALREWHRNWLGLRPQFSPKVSLQNTHILDPRPAKPGYSGGVPSTFTAYLWGTHTGSSSGPMLAQPTSNELTEDCAGLVNGQQVTIAGPQPFDPRTTMMVFEHRNPLVPQADVFSQNANGVWSHTRQTGNRWEIAAAWVHPSSLAEFKQLLLATYPDLDAGSAQAFVNANCAAASAPYIAKGYSASLPGYHLCRGRVMKPDLSGYALTDLSDIFLTGKATSGQYQGMYEYLPASQAATYAGTSAKLSKLGDTVMRYYDPADRRVRRYSPTGLQNGYSVVKRGYSESTAYSCNTLTRFYNTCAYRPPSASWFANDDLSWSADRAAMTVSYTFERRYAAANPHFLNQFRCGLPSKSGLNQINLAGRPPGADHETFEEAMYPRGYSASGYLAASPVAAAGLNDVAMGGSNNADAYYPTAGPENVAVNRLLQDMDEEPYQLLEHIIRNNRPYSELFTAEYTLGHEELEIHYRQQGHLLPVRPNGYTYHAPGTAARDALRIIDFSTMEDIPLGWLRSSWGTLPALENVALMPATTSQGRIRPKAAAGILTMPAFVVPVLSKNLMRTLSSRYFQRLLCGLPNVYVPAAGEAAVHEKYMLSPANPVANATAKAHFDKTSSCYQCHVNLDPLAQALSKNFLEWVQRDEKKASFGEMDSTKPPAYLPSGMYGVRNGGELGTGAFLGAEVTGVQGVAARLVKSPLWGRCVVQKAFENVYGRPVAFADIGDFNEVVNSFMGHNDYNRMIRELVARPLFERDN